MGIAGVSGGVGGGGGASSTAAVAYRAALTKEEQWETLAEMAQCTARLSPEDTAWVQVRNPSNLTTSHVRQLFDASGELPCLLPRELFECACVCIAGFHF